MKVLLSLILIIIVIVIWHYWNIKIIAKKLCHSVLTANKEYEELFTYKHFVKTADVDLFTQKYKKLFSQLNVIKASLWVNKELTGKQECLQFIQKYTIIQETRHKNNSIYESVKLVNEELEKTSLDQDKFNSFKVYHSSNSIMDHKSICEPLYDAIVFLLNEQKLNLVTNCELARRFKEEYEKTIAPSTITSYNREFVNRKKEEDKDFFDTCLNYPLDEQQREAILRMENNTLVISSAGSGKTSTLVGKAHYMVEKCYISPKDILIITYTRKAADELKSRLNIEGLVCSTFHGLAFEIITKATGQKPNICESSLLLNSFYEMLNNDIKFKNAINQYLLEYRSQMKLGHDYDCAYDYYRDRKKYGRQAIFPDKDGKTIFTKSEEEKRICGWLSTHGIKFSYEEPYQYDTANEEYRQYKPDFTIYYTSKDGVEHILYYEHYAINSKGDVPYWFGSDSNDPNQDDGSVTKRWKEANKKYKEGIKWKRTTHENYNTNLIYTTSAMFHDGSIWNNLEALLSKNGVPIIELSAEEIYSMVVARNRGIEKSIFKLIEQFIALQKSNCLKYSDLIKRAKCNNDGRSEFIISNIIEPVAKCYQKNLNAIGAIDFTDCITEATKLCIEGKWKEYDYILVDEFQDISIDRYKFLLSLRNLKATKIEKILSDVFPDIDNYHHYRLSPKPTVRTDTFTKLFCVGDDWQSIYRFSGSDMSLFYDFDKYFGTTERCKIETTYRFFEPTIRLSSEFIQKNPYQVTKTIKDSLDTKPEIKMLIERLKNESRLQMNTESVQQIEDQIQMRKSKYKTNIDFHSYESEYDEKTQIESLIRGIPSDESVIILGRYNYDIKSIGYNLSPQDEDKREIIVSICGRHVRFMSVHSAKGLEADHVILLNCNQGINGFPSLIEDDPILTFVLSDKDKFENAEERRVFYVAITRAKKNTHVFFNSKKPSCFVEEFVGFFKKNVTIPCPICGQGHLYIIKEGESYKGPWLLLGCSNLGSGCPYKKLSTPYQFNEMTRDFNKRNAAASVQAQGINSTKMIEKYIESRKIFNRILNIIRR